MKNLLNAKKMFLRISKAKKIRQRRMIKRSLKGRRNLPSLLS